MTRRLSPCDQPKCWIQGGGGGGGSRLTYFFCYFKRTLSPCLANHDYIPANTEHLPNVVLMLGQRRRRWANIETAFGECPVFAGIVVFNLFYLSTKLLVSGMKCVSKHQNLQIFVLKLNKYEYFSAT